jgi:hypothetical protein
MRRLIIGAVVVLAMSAAAISSASARTTVVLRTARGPLAPGQEMSMFSANLFFELGEIECSSTTARMIVGNSNGPGTITSIGLTGEEPGEACRTAVGPATVAASGLPWSIAFTVERKPVVTGSVIINGGKVVVDQSLISTFFGKGNPELTTRAAKLKGTFNIGGAMTITVDAKVTNKGKVNGGITINAGGRLRLSGDLTSEGEPVEAALETIK